MAIGEFCNREVVVTDRETTVAEASKLMRQHHVGDLVVVDERDGMRIPAGIVTDRDVVVELVALGLDPDTITVGDIMGLELATVRESNGVFDTVQLMRSKGVRRVPVVSNKGALVGIVTVDDLIQLLAEEMGELSKLIAREQAVEERQRK